MYDLSDTQLLIRLIAALLLGGSIGFERELKNRAAGLRTHALAAEGAAIFTMAGLLMAQESELEGIGGFDVARIAAAVATGIGFLAAGVIFSHRENVKGLTTAAGLWVTAAIGLLCGAGFIYLAIAATVATGIVLFVLKEFEKGLLNTD